MTRQATRLEAPATSRALSMPSGVSIMHQIVVRSGAPASTIRASSSATMAAVSTLGSRIASGPQAAAAATSSRPQGVSRPFTRIASSRRP